MVCETWIRRPRTGNNMTACNTISQMTEYMTWKSVIQLTVGNPYEIRWQLAGLGNHSNKMQLLAIHGNHKAPIKSQENKSALGDYMKNRHCLILNRKTWWHFVIDEFNYMYIAQIHAHMHFCKMRWRQIDDIGRCICNYVPHDSRSLRSTQP